MTAFYNTETLARVNQLYPVTPQTWPEDWYFDVFGHLLQMPKPDDQPAKDYRRDVKNRLRADSRAAKMTGLEYSNKLLLAYREGYPEETAP